MITTMPFVEITVMPFDEITTMPFDESFIDADTDTN